MRTSMLAVSAVTFMIASISACKHRVSFETSSNPPSATQSSTQDRFTDEIQGDMQRKLKAILPQGWSISSDSNSITLTRNEKAFIFSSMQWPAFSDKSFDEMVRQYGQEIVYRLTLRFIPRLKQTQYVALKQAWLACEVENKPGPTFSIENWQKAQDCYHAKQPPVYCTNTYTIYIDQPDWWSELKIYPEAAANESNKVHASLDKLFSRYEKVQAHK